MSARDRPVTSALVVAEDTIVGRIERTRDGAVFEYDASFVARAGAAGGSGIAYRLPLSRPRVETRGANLHPFFAGLLPEGARLQALLGRVKTSADDLLSLVVAAGPDCVGDVWVVAEGRPPSAVTPTLDVDAIASCRFADVLGESLAGARGKEPSIPGAQDKISAAMISLPVRGLRGGNRSYILKLIPPKVPHLVENEHFFLRMAAASGLVTASSRLVHDRDGAAGLLVERFDRSNGPQPHKLHQEDACQFLERYPADKYALSAAEVAQGIAELGSAPLVELSKYLRLTAFSYLVANGDLHAKNVSLRTALDGRIELTPAYDVLSTLPYGDQSLALPIDGRDDNLRRKGLVRFGERFGVRPAATHAMLDELCAEAPAWIERASEIGFDARKTSHLQRTMTKRMADLRGD